MSIKQKVEELKEEIKRECGVNANIEINIHQNGNKLNFKKINEIGNILHRELKGKKKIDSNYGMVWVHNAGGSYKEYSNQIAHFAIFLDKEKARVN